MDDLKLVNNSIRYKKYDNSFIQYFIRNKSLYIMILPGLLILLLFKYLPMYGAVVSFMDYVPTKGILGSPWVGLKHYIRFFNDPYFFRTFRNTFTIGIYQLIFGFPAPIILALLINEIRNVRFKKIFQTVSYMPYFLSVVIVVGMLMDITSMSEGVVNDLISFLGGERINFFDRPEWFIPMYIISGIWQSVGYGSIIYLAAIAGINVEMYESAIIDGAGRLKQIIYITLPSILPTITILFILSMGGILGNDFQKILLMYKTSTYETADVIQTYVYRAGIEGASFSYSSAAGMFLSVVSFIFLYATNRLSKIFGNNNLW